MAYLDKKKLQTYCIGANKGKNTYPLSSFRTYIKTTILPLCLIIASFGPYISQTLGLRTEHVVMYTLFPLAMANLAIRKTNAIFSYRPLHLLLFLWIFVTLWTLAFTFAGGWHYESFPKLLSHFQHYFQFIAIITIFGTFISCKSSKEAQNIFLKLCKILIFMLVLNTLVSVLTVFVDTWEILKYFHGPVIDDEITAARGSLLMGRFTGIFDQPAECGLAYSLGLFAWVYIIGTKATIKTLDALILCILFIGGILSVSKVFIFGGLPLAFIYALWTIKLKVFLRLRHLPIIIIALYTISILYQKWDIGENIGLEFFLRLFKADDFNLWTITGNRFGGVDGSDVIDAFVFVWNEAPIYGLGFAAKTTLDNGYLEFFLQGGLIGLIIYLLVLLSIGWTGFKNYKKCSEGKFLLILVPFIIGAGLGAPVLTINRFSTICITFLFLAYLVLYLSKVEAFAKSHATAHLDTQRLKSAEEKTYK